MSTRPILLLPYSVRASFKEKGPHGIGFYSGRFFYSQRQLLKGDGVSKASFRLESK